MDLIIHFTLYFSFIINILACNVFYKHNLFSSNASYNLLIFGNQGCEACSMLMEDIYNDIERFIENLIDINFIWLDTGGQSQDINSYLENKINNYNLHPIKHFNISRNEYQNLGFKSAPIPLILVYNAAGELRFQSFGYSILMVDQIIHIDNLTKPFIQGWK